MYTRILIKLALFYNVSVDYLLNLTDEIKPYHRIATELIEKNIS